jgi:hypothetical protein
MNSYEFETGAGVIPRTDEIALGIALFGWVSLLVSVLIRGGEGICCGKRVFL